MTETQPVPDAQPVRRTCPFDPPEGYRALREHDPVAPMILADGLTGVIVSGYDEVRAVLTDPRFSARHRRARPGQTVTDDSPLPAHVPGMFIMMDAPEHTRFRRLLTGKFTVRRMRQLTPKVTQYVAEQLDEMARTGGPADLVQMFALPVPSLMICELLGVPYADRADFQANSATIVDMDAPPEDATRARIAMYQYIHELVRAKRAEPTDDLLSDLVTTGELTDDELAGVGMLLLIAGHETTANMIALSTLCLLSHPDQLAALRAEPQLIDGAVEELLRYLTIVHLGLRRTARQDVELRGRTIKAGSTVVAALASANREAGRFAGDPDTFDVRRPRGAHLAFGHGIHQCLGQQLARIELTIALGALFERFPGLRLAVPVRDVPMRDSGFVYGPRELLVTWDTEVDCG
ncbi:cytochrome P450 [Nonomuraea sp. NPDC049709]|uniref:cytochrome P450 n=1 Tax=Nonomuraea sp. NPDC049709 TaxID=3154736 RepID=UPI00341487E6